MKEKNEIIIESVAQKAAETAKALRMCSQPELLADAVKVVKKQIPFRYRRYAAAWLLMQAASDEVSDSKTQPRKTTKKTTPEGFVNLFVGCGKRNRVSSDALMKHFGKVLDIPLTKIAAARVLPAFSFIEIDETEAERAIKEVNGTVLNGKKLTVSYGTKK